jgi:hypothetical protein
VSSPTLEETDPANDGLALGALLLGLQQPDLSRRQRRRGWSVVGVLAERYVAAKHQMEAA